MIKRESIQIRDPYILKAEQRYYLFGSTDANIWGQGTSKGFDVYVSDDLESWDGPRKAFYPDESYWGKDNYWAPEVHYYQGKYYMFATFRGQDKMRGTAVLISDQPEGPYKPWSNGPVTPNEWMSLDGTFYIDNQKQPWIIFCHEWVQIKNGTICAMRLSEDLKVTIGEPIILLHSTDAPWSDVVHSNEHKMTGWVTDGPNMHRMKDGRLIMIWSCMEQGEYTLGYAISDNGDIEGPWKQISEPLFREDGGHGMIFDTYDGQLYLAIHQPNESPKERAVFVPIKETDNGLDLAMRIEEAL